ncbi:hypothetical protein BDW71DRAFT_191692, partial [Aspergillus fruticulosus]
MRGAKWHSQASKLCVQYASGAASLIDGETLVSDGVRKQVLGLQRVFDLEIIHHYGKVHYQTKDNHRQGRRDSLRD